MQFMFEIISDNQYYPSKTKTYFAVIVEYYFNLPGSGADGINSAAGPGSVICDVSELWRLV
jgi:hypothetical protein